MKEFLPIGSVVLLHGAQKKLVITGILQFNEKDKSVLYDYQGVLYPEGHMGENSVYLFNQEAISDVIFTGYDNPERQTFLKALDAVYEEAKKRLDEEVHGNGKQ